MIKNIIRNAKETSIFTANGKSDCTYDHFTVLATELTEQKGNKHVIERVLDYTDTYNDQIRYHYSFDLIELINE